MLAIAYGSGLRRSEVVALTIGDYSPTEGKLKVARTLERMTVLLIDLATRNKWNWNAGFKLVR